MAILLLCQTEVVSENVNECMNYVGLFQLDLQCLIINPYNNIWSGQTHQLHSFESLDRDVELPIENKIHGQENSM